MKFFWSHKKKLSGEELVDSKDLEIRKDLENLLNQCKKNIPNFDDDLVTKAFFWAVDAHKNQLRKSGDPYYKHPLAVAQIVVDEIPLDDISVASALMHDILNRSNKYNIEDIRAEFGNTIAEIVDGITKIKFVENQNMIQIENYRKMLLSLFKDVRIILIKIADRMHNMRTLEYLDYDKQKKVASETMEIYVPFAHRFGLGDLKWDLEDLSFKHLNRPKYNEIKEAIQLTLEEREEYIKNFTKPIKERLAKVELIKKNNIKYEVFGRPKHIYSIYNKTLIREKSIEELYDLFAVRIIMDHTDSSYCFLAYGILSEIYKPVPGTFKNYISTPKKNGYQSIHTAVIGPQNKLVEVQIRTKTMHEISEKGVAAHFKYKRGFLPAESVLDNENIEEWMDLVRNIFENIGDEPADQLLDTVKKNLFQDEIYVFTPANEFRIMPKDSTPLDFAFYIHTDIGNHCIGAKVSGKIVPLDYKLQTGDKVEILTSEKQKPTKEWLKIVVSNKAKTHILKHLKEVRKKYQSMGTEIWSEFIAENKLIINDEQFQTMITDLKYSNKDDFFYALGSNENNIEFIAGYLIDILKNGSTDDLKHKIELKTSEVGFHNQSGDYPDFLNDTNFPISYSECCNPLPGDQIVGIISNMNEIVIHRKDCSRIQDLMHTKQPSVFEIDWTNLSGREFESKIFITGSENSSLLNEINSLIMSLNNTILKGFRLDTKDEGFEGFINVNVKNINELNELFEKLKSIKGINSVERFLE